MNNIYPLYQAKNQYASQGEEEDGGEEFNSGCPFLKKKG
jgi:hypothetical protein